MADGTWPSAREAVNQFYQADLRPALDLWDHFYVRSGGPGRRAGPRQTQWLSTLVVTYAALEAGLENIVVAAHGHRNSKTGHDTLSRKRREHLVENSLSSPTVDKIENTMFAHFGIELGPLPDVAMFTAYTKPVTNEGEGRPQSSPTDWTSLRDFLRALSYIRNAFAHSDTRRLQSPPEFGKGHLWAGSKTGDTWSFQQPHALTGIRTVISVYNTVAHALDNATGFFCDTLLLRVPDEVIPYNR